MHINTKVLWIGGTNWEIWYVAQWSVCLIGLHWLNCVSLVKFFNDCTPSIYLSEFWTKSKNIKKKHEWLSEIKKKITACSFWVHD